MLTIPSNAFLERFSLTICEMKEDDDDNDHH